MLSRVFDCYSFPLLATVWPNYTRRLCQSKQLEYLNSFLKCDSLPLRHNLELSQTLSFSFILVLSLRILTLALFSVTDNNGENNNTTIITTLRFRSFTSVLACIATFHSSSLSMYLCQQQLLSNSSRSGVWAPRPGLWHYHIVCNIINLRSQMELSFQKKKKGIAFLQGIQTTVECPFVYLWSIAFLIHLDTILLLYVVLQKPPKSLVDGPELVQKVSKAIGPCLPFPQREYLRDIEREILGHKSQI